MDAPVARVADNETIININSIKNNDNKCTAWEFETNAVALKNFVAQNTPGVIAYVAGQYIEIAKPENVDEVGNKRNYIISFVKNSISSLADNIELSILRQIMPEATENELQQYMSDFNNHNIQAWTDAQVLRLIAHIKNKLPLYIQYMLPEDLSNLETDLNTLDKVLTISCKLTNGTNISIGDDGKINCNLQSGNYINILSNGTINLNLLSNSPYISITPSDEIEHTGYINFKLDKSETIRFTKDENKYGDDNYHIESPVVTVAQNSADVLSVNNKLQTNNNDNPSPENSITEFELSLNKDALARQVITIVNEDNEFVDSLKGEKGEQGEKGDKGDKGEQGDSPSVEVRNNYLYINGIQTVKLVNEDPALQIDVDRDGQLFINGISKGYVSQTGKINDKGIDKLVITSSDGLIAERTATVTESGMYVFDLTCTEQFKSALENKVTNNVYDKIIDKLHTETAQSSGSGNTVNITIPEIKNSINQEIQQTGSDLHTTISQIAEKAAEKVANDPTSNTYKAPVYTMGDNVYASGGYGFDIDENNNVVSKNDPDEENLFSKIWKGVLKTVPVLMNIAAPEYAPLVSAVTSFFNTVTRAQQENSVGAWYNGIPTAMFGNSTFLGEIVDIVKDYLDADTQAILPGNNKQLDSDYNARMPIYTINARDYNFSSPSGTIAVEVTENGKKSSDINIDISSQAMLQLKGEKGDRGDPGVSGVEGFGITFDPTIVINNIGRDTDVVPGGNTIIEGGNIYNNTYNVTTDISNKASLFTLLQNIQTKPAPQIKITSLNTIEMVKIFQLDRYNRFQTSANEKYDNIGISKTGKLYGYYNSSWNEIGSLVPTNLPVAPIISDVSLCVSKQAFLLVASNVNAVYVSTYELIDNVTNITHYSVLDTSSYSANPYGQNGGECCDYIDVGDGEYFYVAPSNNDTTASLLKISIHSPENPTVTTVADFDRSRCLGDIDTVQCLYIYENNAQTFNRCIVIVTKTGNCYKQIGTYSAEYFSLATATSLGSSTETIPLGCIKYVHSSSEPTKVYNTFIFFKYRTFDNSNNSYSDWQYSYLGLTGKVNTFLQSNITIPAMEHIVSKKFFYSATAGVPTNLFCDVQGNSFLIKFNYHDSTNATLNTIKSVTKILPSSMEDNYDGYYAPRIGALQPNDELLYIDENYKGLACTHNYYSLFDNDLPTVQDFELYATILGTANTYKVIRSKYIFDGYISALIELTHLNNNYQFFVYSQDGGTTWKQITFAANSHYIDFIRGNDGILFIPDSGTTYAVLKSINSSLRYKELPEDLYFDDAIGGYSVGNKYFVVRHSIDDVETVYILEGTIQSTGQSQTQTEIVWNEEETEYTCSDFSDYDEYLLNGNLISVSDFKLVNDDTIHSIVIIPYSPVGFIYAIDGEFSLWQNELSLVYVKDNVTIDNYIKFGKPVFNGQNQVAMLCHEYFDPDDEDRYALSQIAIYPIISAYGEIEIDEENPTIIDCPTISDYRPAQLIYVRNNQQWALFYKPVNDATKNIKVVLCNDLFNIAQAKSYEIFNTSEATINEINLDTLTFNQYGYVVAGTQNFIYSIVPMSMFQAILHLSNEIQTLNQKERERLITDVDVLNTTIADLQNQISSLNSRISVAVNNNSTIQQINNSITDINQTTDNQAEELTQLTEGQKTLFTLMRQIADALLTVVKTDEAVKTIESVNNQYVSEAKLNHLLTSLRFISGGDNSGASTVNSDDPITWHSLTWAERSVYGGKYGGRQIKKWSDLDLATEDEPDRYVSMSINIIAETLYQLAGIVLKSSMFTNVRDKYFNEGELLKLAYSLGTISVNPNYSGEYNRSRSKTWAELTYGAGARFIDTDAGRTIANDIAEHGETAYDLNQSYIAPTTTVTGTEYHYDIPAMEHSEAVEFLIALRHAMKPIQVPPSDQRRFLEALKIGGSAFDRKLWNYLVLATAYRKQHRKKGVFDLVVALGLSASMTSWGGGTGGGTGTTITLGGDDADLPSGSLNNLDWLGSSFSTDFGSTLGDSHWLTDMSDSSISLISSSSSFIVKG